MPSTPCSEPSSAPLPVLPSPRSFSSMNLLLPPAPITSWADPHCCPHAASASPPVMSSPTDPFSPHYHTDLYQPFGLLHAVIYPCFSFPNPILNRPFAQVLLFFLSLQHPQYTTIPSSPAARHTGGGWLKRKRAGGEVKQTPHLQFLQVSKPHWCYCMGDPLQKCFSQSL